MGSMGADAFVRATEARCTACRGAKSHTKNYSIYLGHDVINTSDPITISMSKNEAIVLFEILSRSTELRSSIVQDKSEKAVFDQLCAGLESMLGGPFQSDFKETLKRAKEDIAGAF